LLAGSLFIIVIIFLPQLLNPSSILFYNPSAAGANKLQRLYRRVVFLSICFPSMTALLP
jgi:hypothetical protein